MDLPLLGPRDATANQKTAPIGLADLFRKSMMMEAFFGLDCLLSARIHCLPFHSLSSYALRTKSATHAGTISSDALSLSLSFNFERSNKHLKLTQGPQCSMFPYVPIGAPHEEIIGQQMFGNCKYLSACPSATNATEALVQSLARKAPFPQILQHWWRQKKFVQGSMCPTPYRKSSGSEGTSKKA